MELVVPSKLPSSVAKINQILSTFLGFLASPQKMFLLAEKKRGRLVMTVLIIWPSAETLLGKLFKELEASFVFHFSQPTN